MPDTTPSQSTLTSGIPVTAFVSKAGIGVSSSLFRAFGTTRPMNFPLTPGPRARGDAQVAERCRQLRHTPRARVMISKRTTEVTATFVIRIGQQTHRGDAIGQSAGDHKPVATQ